VTIPALLKVEVRHEEGSLRYGAAGNAAPVRRHAP
jgi:hypothetical protein